LMDVVDHYVEGGKVKTNLSPLMIQAHLNRQEKQDIVAFMKTLTTTTKTFEQPILPAAD